MTVTEGDDPELRSILMQGLSPMLHPQHSSRPASWLCVALQDEQKSSVGGMIGLMVGAWLSVDLLWLPTYLRKRGHGTALLREAERRALKEGCIDAYVGTSSSDACGFYEKNGYVARLLLYNPYAGLTQTTLQKHF
ncbi:GNAT family N-acetyltransferase [Methylobacterium sp. Leaf469]|uniref:GNAT family N-acetyltransferase n=1 Tax=Methylobacterium sp. Leaf469 TaxID=1736387 RepID=UPI00138ECAD3|nr:GNAT family N-acetyltransferase [Methylobacterium sp. Leaf469]